MNELMFHRGDKSYTIKADGSVSISGSGPGSGATGTWTAKSDEKKNEITVKIPGVSALKIPLTYDFVENSMEQMLNLLLVSISPEHEGGETASAFFTGTIHIDDRKDIEYRLESGLHFILYGELSFAPGYDKLILTTPEGHMTAIHGFVRLKDTFSVFTDERDLLVFFAVTNWKDDEGRFQERFSKIQLRGAYEVKNDSIVFHGKFEDEDTFNIVLAGSYEIVAGAIEIYSADGETEASIRLESQLNFYGATGKWGLILGKSGDELEVSSAIRFDEPITSKDGRVKIVGDAEVGFADNALKAKLNVQAQAMVGDDGILRFHLLGQFISGKPSIVFKGNYIFEGDKKMSFVLGYADSKFKLDLGYESERIRAIFSLVTDGRILSGVLSVTITFDEDGEKPKVGVTERVDTLLPPTEAAAIPFMAAGTAATVNVPDISPRTLPTYPSTGPYRSNDFDLLHPVMRRAVVKLQTRIYQEGIPLFVFEAFRHPKRQNKLFEDPRGVTKARAWQSYHQYGVAADFVFYENGRWHWGRNSQHDRWYNTLHRFGRELGLQRLSWETPHLQMAELELDNLRKGRYPAGGDSMWGEHLVAVIADWNAAGGTPEAPPVPQDWKNTDRPSLVIDIPDEGRRRVTEDDVGDSAKFHSRYGGTEWKVSVGGTQRGIILRGRNKPERTSGEPVTCRRIVTLYGDFISKYAIEYQVPEELIIMTIATETAAYRNVGFTGPKTFRWEAHISEYSAGPMQLLSSTTRELIERYNLSLDPWHVAPRYGSRPVHAPVDHPMYEPELNIQLGTLEIKHRLGITGYDPILVASAYNAGGLYPTEANHWHLRSHGNHLDRAASWFGDACSI